MTQHQLVGSAELQHLLGVKRQRVSVLVAGAGFPAPVAMLRMGQVWDLDDVRAWAEEVGRTLHDLPKSWPLPVEGEEQSQRSGRYRRS